MKILVTGATGGCGRLIVRRLGQLDYPVRALTRKASRADFGRGVDVVEGNALVPEDCSRAVAGCDAVISTMGERRVPADGRIVDGAGTRRLIAAAEAAGVQRFVLISSLGVADSWAWLPAPVKLFFKIIGAEPILRAKADAETAVRASRLQGTILRPGGLLNARMRAAPLLVRPEVRVPGFTTRQAVADVAVRCLRSHNAASQTLTVVNGGLRRWMRGVEPVELAEPWVAWE